MNRLLKLFSEIPHRFVISLGLIGDQYEIYSNQYGEKYLNQLSVLQTADVYITHGVSLIYNRSKNYSNLFIYFFFSKGNNSVTEACHVGIPMIVIPLFADQFDNSRRIEDKGYGVQLSAFYSTKKDFERSIEFCTGDEMRERLKKISIRIKNENGLKAACQSIVNLID